MANFADIVNEAVVVPYKGTDFEVSGLEIAQLLALVKRFPTFAAGFDGGDMVLAIIECGSDVAAAIIAMATGNSESDVKAAKLAAGDQAEFLFTVLDLTFPGERSLPKMIAQVLALANRAGA